MSRSLSTPDLIAAFAPPPSIHPLHSTSIERPTSSVSSSLDRTTSTILPERTRSNELTVPNGAEPTNGSLISFGTVQLMQSCSQLMEEPERRISLNSAQSDLRRNLISLQTVGRTLQRTHNHLKRTRLLHLFYILALPVYTIVGALIFQALDGEYDDQILRLFKNRCISNRDEELKRLSGICGNGGADCVQKIQETLAAVDRCYREWPTSSHTALHPMSDFTNAIVYAFSVYTSIGYGTISPSKVETRMATILYAAFGIPLFFAFVKEEGNQCRILFIRVYNWVSRWRRRRCGRGWQRTDPCPKVGDAESESLTNNMQTLLESSRPPLSDPLGSNSTDQRRVFIASVVVFIIYLMLASYIFSVMTKWDFFTSFYFTFSSVALIGFGDVYPNDPKIILANMVFIVIGVILFSMCYFILQEKIRVKAFEASRRARMSISKYSHSLMLHTRTPWSRRNSPAFDQNENSDSEAAKNFQRNRKRRQSAPAIAPVITVQPTD